MGILMRTTIRSMRRWLRSKLSHRCSSDAPADSDVHSYFVADYRHTGENGPQHAGEDVYMLYEGGHKKPFSAGDLSLVPRSMYSPPDNVYVVLDQALSWNTERASCKWSADSTRPGTPVNPSLAVSTKARTSEGCVLYQLLRLSC